MRSAIIPLAVAGGLLLGACHTPDPADVEINAPGASVSISSGRHCAGQVTMLNGVATVENPCFTADTNIVLSTDVTNANPVRCAPTAGSLLVGGTGNDVIAYALMR